MQATRYRNREVQISSLLPSSKYRGPLSEYELDPGLIVYVSNDLEMTLQVKVHYTEMASKSGGLPMELLFYAQPGSSLIANELTPISSVYYTQNSHNTSRMSNVQAIFLPTLLHKLALSLSENGSDNATLCTRNARPK
jgi:hypothetical protein